MKVRNDEQELRNNSEYYYSDIAPSFKPHPVTGDLVRTFDVTSVKNAVVNILKTTKGARPFTGAIIDGGIDNLLFENFSPFLVEELKTTIHLALANHEPRIQVLDITIEDDTDNNALVLNFRIRLNTHNQDESFKILLRRA